MKEIRREGYSEDDQIQAPPISTLNCRSLFSRGKKQKRTQELRLVPIPEGAEEEEDEDKVEEVADEKEAVKDQEVATILVKAAIIVCHGSFNPVHHHHIEMMVAAKTRLENEGFTVVKGLMGVTSQKARSKVCKDCFAYGWHAMTTSSQKDGCKATQMGPDSDRAQSIGHTFKEKKTTEAHYHSNKRRRFSKSWVKMWRTGSQEKLQVRRLLLADRTL